MQSGNVIFRLYGWYRVTGIKQNLKGENPMDKNTNEHKYLSYGIPAGLLLGTAVAVLTSLNIGVCAGVGMLGGIVVGTIIDAEKNKSDPSNKQ